MGFDNYGKDLAFEFQNSEVLEKIKHKFDHTMLENMRHNFDTVIKCIRKYEKDNNKGRKRKKENT